MRTTATFTLGTTPQLARDVTVAFLRGEGLDPVVVEDWDGSALWGSCALRFAIAHGGQGYMVGVHIRDLAEPGVPRCSLELRQDALAYGSERSLVARPLVAVEHLDDALRSVLSRRGVLERVEQFV